MPNTSYSHKESKEMKIKNKLHYFIISSAKCGRFANKWF